MFAVRDGSCGDEDDEDEEAVADDDKRSCCMFPTAPTVDDLMPQATECQSYFKISVLCFWVLTGC